MTSVCTAEIIACDRMIGMDSVTVVLVVTAIAAP